MSRENLLRVHIIRRRILTNIESPNFHGIYSFIFLLYIQVLVPLLSNERNHESWPVVVSQDVLRHVHQLKNNVFVIAGQVKGRTLLPLPVGADKIAEAANDSNNNAKVGYVFDLFSAISKKCKKVLNLKKSLIGQQTGTIFSGFFAKMIDLSGLQQKKKVLRNVKNIS